MALITWNETLNVGVASMDRQHREMADLVNLIHDNLLQGVPDAELRQNFDLLAAATVAHFRHEQDLWTRTDYPAAAGHKHKHDLLMVVLDRFRETLDRDTSQSRLEQQLDYLREWLLDHIDDEDKPLAAHLNAAGIS